MSEELQAAKGEYAWARVHAAREHIRELQVATWPSERSR